MKFRKLLIFVIITLGIVLFTLYTPVGAVKRHLFFDNPIQSLTCFIKKSDFIDTLYGQQYQVYGFNGIYFAYVKRNSIGWCYWSGGGSGP